MATRVQSLLPQEAAEFLAQHPESVFVDVRSSMEFLFVGHPVGATNIAWIDDPDWSINPNFAIEIEREAKRHNAEAPKAVPIVLICRSGVRSLEGGHVLVKAGFSQVYNVLEGFEGDLDDNHHRGTENGWRFHGLPWEQC